MKRFGLQRYSLRFTIVRGVIAMAWEQTGNRGRLTVECPALTSADLRRDRLSHDPALDRDSGARRGGRCRHHQSFPCWTRNLDTGSYSEGIN